MFCFDQVKWAGLASCITTIPVAKNLPQPSTLPDDTGTFIHAEVEWGLDPVGKVVMLLPQLM